MALNHHQTNDSRCVHQVEGRYKAPRSALPCSYSFTSSSLGIRRLQSSFLSVFSHELTLLTSKAQPYPHGEESHDERDEITQHVHRISNKRKRMNPGPETEENKKEGKAKK